MAVTLLIESTGELPTLEGNLLSVPAGQKVRIRMISSDRPILQEETIIENDDTKVLMDRKIEEDQHEARLRLKDIYHLADHILIRPVPRSR